MQISRTEFCKKFSSIVNSEYLTEVRIIKNRDGVINLFFDDVEKLYDAIVPHNGINNIYWTINPISKEYFKPATGGTKDDHISKRQYILIDIDTLRDKDTSATDEQLEEARKVAEKVVKHFDRNEKIVIMSGNGYHILLRCDILNDALNTARVRNFLEAVSRKFSNNFCRIDTNVFNASRIVRIPYTINVKGNIHREAVIISVKKSEEKLSSMSLDLFCGTENENLNDTIKTSFERTDFFDALSKCKKQLKDAYTNGIHLNVRGGEGRELTLNILGELRKNGLKSPHFACKWLFGKDYNADITEREWKYIKPIPMSAENVKKFFPNYIIPEMKKKEVLDECGKRGVSLERHEGGWITSDEKTTQEFVDAGLFVESVKSNRRKKTLTDLKKIITRTTFNNDRLKSVYTIYFQNGLDFDVEASDITRLAIWKKITSEAGYAIGWRGITNDIVDLAAWIMDNCEIIETDNPDVDEIVPHVEHYLYNLSYAKEKQQLRGRPIKFYEDGDISIAASTMKIVRERICPQYTSSQFYKMLLHVGVVKGKKYAGNVRVWIFGSGNIHNEDKYQSKMEK